MRLFQFRDLTEIEAFVIAAECERATEIFQLYLRARGGDPDALMWRDLQSDDLEPMERSAVTDAVATDREGLVVSDTAGGWVFIIPVGDETSGQSDER